MVPGSCDGGVAGCSGELDEVVLECAPSKRILSKLHPVVICELGYVAYVCSYVVVPSFVRVALASAYLSFVSVEWIPADGEAAPPSVVLCRNVVCPAPFSSPERRGPRVNVEVVQLSLGDCGCSLDVGGPRLKLCVLVDGSTASAWCANHKSQHSALSAL